MRADGSRKGFLWLGLSGKVTVMLNGQQIAEEENITRYRVGQVQKPIELRAGDNLFIEEGATIQAATCRTQIREKKLSESVM